MSENHAVHPSPTPLHHLLHSFERLFPSINACALIFCASESRRQLLLSTIFSLLRRYPCIVFPSIEKYISTRIALFPASDFSQKPTPFLPHALRGSFLIRFIWRCSKRKRKPQQGYSSTATKACNALLMHTSSKLNLTALHLRCQGEAIPLTAPWPITTFPFSKPSAFTGTTPTHSKLVMHRLTHSSISATMNASSQKREQRRSRFATPCHSLSLLRGYSPYILGRFT